jgi:HK97 family phage major capsid protein/HK97 family phage prohead protease
MKEVLYRSISLERSALDEEKRTVPASLSSEEPVERFFGREILSHEPGAVDLTRAQDGLPLLFNHDTDQPIGVVEGVKLSGRKLRGTLRFGKSSRANEIFEDIKGGVLRNVSVGYLIDDVKDEPSDDGEPRTYRATHWRLLEASVVAVPADPTVGVGRSFQKRGNSMEDENNELQSRGARRSAAAAQEQERERIRSIQALCKTHRLGDRIADEWIENGVTIEEARGQVLRKIESRPQEPVSAFSGELGLTEREVKRFSIVRGINAIVNQDWSRAGFERECSRGLAKKLGRETQGFFVPMEVQQQSAWGKRAPYAVGATATGGALVETDLLVDNFIEVLRNASRVLQAGATLLPGLVGNVDIPRRIGATNTFWVGESGALTEAEATYDKVTLRPKTVGALSKMSRLTLLQTTPAIEMLTRNDMAAQVGLAIDLAALSGSGAANQPLGIANTVGIGSVVGGVNGAAVTIDNVIDLEAQIANQNAPEDALAYLFNSKTIASLKKLKASTGQYLWTNSPPGQRSATPGAINGIQAYRSNQLRSNLVKGTSGAVCSELVFGNWSELLIGEWGVLEILVNPFDSTGFTTGDVLIRAFQTLDIGVRHAVSFAYMSDALTP